MLRRNVSRELFVYCLIKFTHCLLNVTNEPDLLPANRHWSTAQYPAVITNNFVH